MRVWFVLGILSVVLGSRTECIAQKTPRIVAHRGLMRYAPENTLANFRACLELRLGFECDVQRTKDGMLVCIHDTTVNRTTNGKGKVEELTMEAIRRLDAGAWYDSRFANEKVPTLEEVFQLLADHRQHDVLVTVDLKAVDVEKDVVRLAVKLGVLDKLLFIGRTITEPTVRKNILETSPKAHVAVVANFSKEFTQAMEEAHAQWVYVRFLPTKEQIEAAHRAGKQVFIAGPTVSGNLPNNWRRAAKVGIDGILTDYPLATRITLKRATIKD